MAIKINKEEEKIYDPAKVTSAQNVQSTPQTANNVDNVGTAAATKRTSYTPSKAVTAAQDYLKQVRDGGYNRQWSQTLDALVNEYMGRGEFSYDAGADVTWQQAKAQGLDAANLAMRDTVAQAAALSGGYGNSYAGTVGQQVYQQGVADVMAMQPEYLQAAYQRYKDEGDAMLQNISLAQSMDEAAYARFADELSRAQAEYEAAYARDYGEFSDQRAYDYQLGRDAVSDQRYNTEWAHQLEREGVEDQRYADEWQYQKDRDAVSDSRYDTEWQYQLDRDAVADERYAAELQYQKDRDAVEDARYDAEQQYRADRDAIEDERYNTEWEYQKERDTLEDDYNDLKALYDAYVKEQEAAEEEALSEEEYYEKIESLKTTPRFRDAVVRIRNATEGGQDVKEFIAALYDNGDFGMGVEAEDYLLALCDEFKLNIEDVLGS